MLPYSERGKCTINFMSQSSYKNGINSQIFFFSLNIKSIHIPKYTYIKYVSSQFIFLLVEGKN